MRTFHIKNKWAFFIVLAISVIVYFNSLGNGFQYDDKFYIKDNFYIRDIANIPGAFRHPSYLAVGSPSGHYRPLLFTSYALNYYFGGLNPIGYRIINLAFHGGSAFLVFLILQAMLVPPTPSLPPQGGGKKGGGNSTLNTQHSTLPYVALASALIFAVHPFNSEVVNYISTRSSVMSGFFYLLAFYCWVKYSQAAGTTPTLSLPHQGGGKKGGGTQAPTTYYLLPTTYYYIASLLAFLLGMLTKETVITLPIVLWLYDIYFYRTFHPPLNPLPSREGKLPATRYPLPAALIGHARRFIAYFPFVFILAGAYFAVRIFYWRSLIPPFKRDLLTQFYTEMPVLAKYVRLLFIPVGLNVDHYVAIYSRPALPAIGSFLFLILVIAAGVWLFRSKRIEWRIVSFFIFWFFIVLLPTTIMPLNAILQENRGYLAGIAFATLIGVFIWQGGVVAGFSLRSRNEKLEVRSEKLEARGYACIALIGILIVIFSITTIQRNTVWINGLTLWEDAVSKSPLSSVAHHNLAYYYEEEGKVRRAIKEYLRVIDLDPTHVMSYYNLGRLYRGLGMNNEAVDAYKRAIMISPDYYKVYNNLGIIYDDMGMHDLAIEGFKKAIEINPGYIMARMNLGKMYEKTGRLDLAAGEFEVVIKLARRGSEEEKKIYEAMRHLEWIRGKQ